MSEMTREARLLETFAKLADTLTDDYDVVDMLQTLVDTCLEVFDTTAAGILLANGGGELELIVSTSEASRFVEILQLGAEAGPCIESYRTGEVVSVPDISASPDEWSAFRTGAIEQGFASAHAVPLRLRETTIGTLNLLNAATGDLDASALTGARALADVATIGIIQERSLRESALLSEQLQNALNSRIVIEQAKGVVAHTHGVAMDDAFTLIRRYARSHQLTISSVAEGLVNLSISLRD